MVFSRVLYGLGRFAKSYDLGIGQGFLNDGQGAGKDDLVVIDDDDGGAGGPYGRAIEELGDIDVQYLRDPGDDRRAGQPPVRLPVRHAGATDGQSVRKLLLGQPFLFSNR